MPRSPDQADAAGGVAQTLPGEELVQKGLADLAAGHQSAEALLLARFATRLGEAGVPVPGERLPDPDRRLYELLCQTEGDRAHSVYNSLTRRLVSYMRAREHALRR